MNKTRRFNPNKPIFIVIFVLILMSSNTSQIAKESNDNNSILNIFTSSPQTAEVGENLNITLHQSYLNIITTEFANLSESHTFNLPCPTDSKFNSSFIEMIFDDIYAPNKSLELELEVSPYFYESLTTSANNKYAFSFQVINSCYLEGFSVCLSENDTDNIDGYIQADLLTAEINGSNIVPSSLLRTLEFPYFITDNIGATWFNFTGYHEFLNTSNTVNNTFFITIRQASDPGQTDVRFQYMPDLLGDLIDSSLVYESDSGDWLLEAWDAAFIVNVSPVYNNVKPSQINLKINNTNVNDNIDNSGSWMSTEEFSNPSGQLEFEFMADWWDVACNLTRAQINYTKTDLRASTTYETPEPNLVLWNASIDSSIDSFDSRINSYNYIQFTIPSNWSDIKAFNGSFESPGVLSGPAINGYRDVFIFGAGNGAKWYLTAVIDNRIPDTGGGVIPFGHYYLLFTTIVVLSLIYCMKRRVN